MIHVTLQPRAPVYPTQSGAPLLTPDEMSAFSSRLSMGDCQTIDCIVEAECRRRGFFRTCIGTPRYKAVEACVVADVVALELDLWEIGAQIQEAKWAGGC
ncbi:hypothetical protein EON83_11020 [bacterium]|nr:MAG: hypothetical protein EON83_11020 [bacterium]